MRVDVEIPEGAELAAPLETGAKQELLLLKSALFEKVVINAVVYLKLNDKNGSHSNHDDLRTAEMVSLITTEGKDEELMDAFIPC